jgi:hypothetical protein
VLIQIHTILAFVIALRHFLETHFLIVYCLSLE